MHAIIAGGGVAGLATALAFKSQNIQFDLFEKSFDTLTAGMGFVMINRGLQILQKLGVEGSSGLYGFPLKRFVLHAANGQVKHVQELAEGTLGVRRKDLLAALLRNIPPECIHFGEAISKFHRAGSDNFRSAELSNGRHVFGDIFVAADGVRSQSRHYLDENWKNTDARVCEMVGLIKDKSLREQLGNEFHKYQHCGGGLALGMIPVDTQHIVWYMQFDKTRFGLPSSEIPLEKHLFVNELVGKWAKPVQRAIASSDFSHVHVWRPVNADPLAQFFVSNLAFVGDAAHPLLPFTSQGLSSAIQDAECLASEVAACREHRLPVNEGLFAYSKKRRQAILPFIAQGRQLTDQFIAAQIYHEQLLPIAK